MTEYHTKFSIIVPVDHRYSYSLYFTRKLLKEKTMEKTIQLYFKVLNLDLSIVQLDIRVDVVPVPGTRHSPERLRLEGRVD